MRKAFLLIIAVCCSVMANSQEIARWSGFRKGAASFTFDDGAPSHISDVAPLFEKYGYRATFCLVVGWNPDWSGFQTLANSGHEICSHSTSHGQNMSGEEASSKSGINAHINQAYGCITVAYPNCNVPNVTAVQENYIAGRICNGSWQSMDDIMGSNGPADWCKVSALMTGSNGLADLRQKMQEAANKTGWVVFLTHGLEGKNNGNATYSPTSVSTIESALKWANQNDQDIWVTPFRNAAMYCKERLASSFTETARNASSVTYSLTHNIADDVCQYDYPLSLRIFDEDRQSVSVKQGLNTLSYEIKDGYIYFDAIPNGGNIVVTTGGTGIDDVFGGSHSAEKKLQDGQIVIERNGKVYDLTGRKL